MFYEDSKYIDRSTNNSHLLLILRDVKGSEVSVGSGTNYNTGNLE